jgi:dolichol-phosphate mannosyltransferase
MLKELYSSDDSIKAIRFSRNFGHHIAISAGLDFASGDLVVMMDGDLQDQPEEIKKLYEAIQSGFDVAAGKRIEKKFSWFKRICSSSFVFIIQKLIDQKIIINNTIFRMMRKQVVEEIKKIREENRYIVGIIGWVGFNHAYVPVVHGERFAGKSKYNLRKQFKLAANAIFSFSDYPLRLISRLGFVLVFLSMLSVFYVMAKNILYATPVLGWASLMSALLFLSGMQIMILGILGEYIGRSYIEIKHRPLYVIAQVLEKK